MGWTPKLWIPTTRQLWQNPPDRCERGGIPLFDRGHLVDLASRYQGASGAAQNQGPSRVDPVMHSEEPQSKRQGQEKDST